MKGWSALASRAESESATEWETTRRPPHDIWCCAVLVRARTRRERGIRARVTPVTCTSSEMSVCLGVISLTSGPEFYYLTSFSEGFVPEKRYTIGKTQYECGIDGKLRISRFQQGVVYPPCSNISWFSMWSRIMLARQASRFQPPEVIWAGYIGNL
jgi:hypothetical protein